VKIVPAVAAVCLLLVLVPGLLVYWYVGEPVSNTDLAQLEHCTDKRSVARLLGQPTSTYYGNGKEWWVYHGSFLGIRTVIHLDVIFTNDTYCGWSKMD